MINKLNEFYSGYNKSSNSIEEQLSTETPVSKIETPVSKIETPVSKIETQELITKRNEVIKKWIPQEYSDFIIAVQNMTLDQLKSNEKRIDYMSGIYNFVAYLDNKQLEEFSNLMEQTIFKSDESGKLIENQIDALLYPFKNYVDSLDTKKTKKTKKTEETPTITPVKTQELPTKHHDLIEKDESRYRLNLTFSYSRQTLQTLKESNKLTPTPTSTSTPPPTIAFAIETQELTNKTP